jgi:putative intracellular protease/amidase
LEDKLKEIGAIYTSKGNSEAYIQQDGFLITGQNPASSDGVAKLLLKTLKNEKPIHS